MQIDDTYLAVLLMGLIETGLQFEAVEVQEGEVLAFAVSIEGRPCFLTEVPRS